MSDHALLLLEMDYTTYGQSCREPHITPSSELVECRRDRGHSADVHATRAGAGIIVWEISAEAA
ncbi:hypothetical protein [Glaciihabitans sp. dw_435]|uniref:hypothetical protein n=1 Tax=Glaciihabitans sp. dw_435 TaxID=2720081 RepID=UPI001BD2163B|nr:hypothetical protein [Glaciihabitans sp. dw_435]